MIVMTDQVRLWTRQNSDMSDSWTLDSHHPGSGSDCDQGGRGRVITMGRPRHNTRPGLTGSLLPVNQPVDIKLPLHLISSIQCNIPFVLFTDLLETKGVFKRDPVDGSHYSKFSRNYGGSRDIVTTSPHDNHENMAVLAPVGGQSTQ